MDDLIFLRLFCLQFFKRGCIGFLVRNVIFKSLIESEPQLSFDLSCHHFPAQHHRYPAATWSLWATVPFPKESALSFTPDLARITNAILQGRWHHDPVNTLRSYQFILVVEKIMFKIPLFRGCQQANHYCVTLFMKQVPCGPCGDTCSPSIQPPARASCGSG